MENNKNSNRGVFPGSSVPAQGTIQPGPPVQGEPKHTAAKTTAPVAPAPSLSHHDNAQTEDSNTFFRIETKNADDLVSGIIEVDLISFRERGQESRYLSVNTEGADEEGNRSTTSINIDNEADFNKFKQFISQLNWND
jgi:hypothetical protein